MARARWLTPDDPADGFIRRIISIPNGVDWLAIVTGALNELIYDRNFEAYGTESVANTVALFKVMFDEFCLEEDVSNPVILAEFNNSVDATLALTPTNWDIFVPNIYFDVASVTDVIELSCSGLITVSAPSAGFINARFSVHQDTFFFGYFNQGGVYLPSSGIGNFLTGGQPGKLTGLAPGTYRADLWLRADVALTAYCRTATYSQQENLRIQVARL